MLPIYQSLHTLSTRLFDKLEDNRHILLILKRKLRSNNHKVCHLYNIGREKGRDLTQSYDKSPYTHRKIQNATWQYKNATKTLD